MDPVGPTDFLNLRLLSYWLVVVEEGSVTAAAKRLSIAQPALSQQIRTLERAMGGELLERHPTGVRLTEAGRALVPEARAIIAGAQRAKRSVRQALNLEIGLLEIATYASFAAGPLLASIEAWHERYPQVPMRVLEFTWRALAENVKRGVLDFGVGLPPNHWAGPLERIGWDRFVVVLPEPLRGRANANVALDAFKDREWVLYTSDLGLSELVSTACTAAGFVPRPAVETSQVDAVAWLAAAGIGPALVPAGNIPAELAAAVRPTDPPIYWPIAAFTRTSWSNTAAAYIEIAKQVNSTSPPDGGVLLSLEMA